MDLYDNKNVKPMLLNEVTEPFNNKNYLFEIKFDGIRAIIYVNENEIIIKNRKGININNIFPELENIKNNIKKKCIFDGEIIQMVDGKPSFSKLQERTFLKDKIKINFAQKNNPVTFVCFDILYENKDLTEYTLKKRKKILEKYSNTKYFVKSKVFENGIKLFNLIKLNNLEGIVAKRKDSIYQCNKRNDNWLKIKNIKEEDFIIGAFKEEKNVASLILCNKKDQGLEFVSKVVVGKNTEEFKMIKNSKKIKPNIYGFEDIYYIYISPNYVCSVIYLGKGKNGHLRHPVFKGLKLE